MQQPAWHPYAPDQAFGQQAARDEELLEQLLARLDGQARPAPRAGNKAPAHEVRSGSWVPTSRPMMGLVDSPTDGPVTTAGALDAAPHAQGQPI